MVGKVFWLGVARAIGGVERGPAREALLALERKELVQRARRSSVEGEAEYAFRHLLVRDVAYGQIPRAARADKHRAAAEWVEGLGRPDDHAEMLASHYSRALEYARAAGSEDGELAERARVRAARRRRPRIVAPSLARCRPLLHRGARALAGGRSVAAAPALSVRTSAFQRGRNGAGHARSRGRRARGRRRRRSRGAGSRCDRALSLAARRVAEHNAYIERALELVGEREESAARVTAIALKPPRICTTAGSKTLLPWPTKACPSPSVSASGSSRRACSRCAVSRAASAATPEARRLRTGDRACLRDPCFRATPQRVEQPHSGANQDGTTRSRSQVTGRDQAER